MLIKSFNYKQYSHISTCSLVMELNSKGPLLENILLKLCVMNWESNIFTLSLICLKLMVR